MIKYVEDHFGSYFPLTHSRFLYPKLQNFCHNSWPSINNYGKKTLLVDFFLLNLTMNLIIVCWPLVKYNQRSLRYVKLDLVF